MRLIDLNESKIIFRALNSGFTGFFDIEACLEVVDKQTGIHKQYFLGAPVLAGNLFVQENLLKKPIYYYQILYSDDEHVIFRNEVSSKLFSKKKHKTTIDKNTFVFDSIFVSKKYTQRVNVNIVNVLKKINVFNLMCVLKVLLFGCELILTFRVKHINLINNLWQLETGPVVLPSFPLWASHLEINQLNPCFIHINNYGCCEITFTFPLFNKTKQIKLNSCEYGVNFYI